MQPIVCAPFSLLAHKQGACFVLPSRRCHAEHVPQWVQHCRSVIHERRGRSIMEEREQVTRPQPTRCVCFSKATHHRAMRAYPKRMSPFFKVIETRMASPRRYTSSVQRSCVFENTERHSHVERSDCCACLQQLNNMFWVLTVAPHVRFAPGAASSFSSLWAFSPLRSCDDGKNGRVGRPG